MLITNKSIMLMLTLVALSACGNNGNQKSSTQVAAKVNNAEISLLQINQVLRNAKNVTPETSTVMRQQVLEKLIDQQIVVERALKDNLDRTPDVMGAIESAKKDILARAYLQKMVASGVKVSDQDVRKYYDEHPELFSKRRIYSLQDIGIEKNGQLLSELNDEVAKQKSMQDIAEWLKDRNIKFISGSYNRPAEQIPLEILPKLQQLKDGDLAVVDVANATHIIKIVKSQEAPIDLTVATPFIKNYFINTKGKALVDNEMKKFRAEAKVEYMGDFAANLSKVDTPFVNNPKKESSPSNKEPNVDKGIAGLK